jgi:hypothetical protein
MLSSLYFCLNLTLGKNQRTRTQEHNISTDRKPEVFPTRFLLLRKPHLSWRLKRGIKKFSWTKKTQTMIEGVAKYHKTERPIFSPRRKKGLNPDRTGQV